MTSFLEYWLALCLLTLADVYNVRALSVCLGNTNVLSGVLKPERTSKSVFVKQADTLKFKISHEVACVSYTSRHAKANFFELLASKDSKLVVATLTNLCFDFFINLKKCFVIILLRSAGHGHRMK